MDGIYGNGAATPNFRREQQEKGTVTQMPIYLSTTYMQHELQHDKSTISKDTYMSARKGTSASGGQRLTLMSNHGHMTRHALALPHVPPSPNFT